MAMHVSDYAAFSERGRHTHTQHTQHTHTYIYTHIHTHMLHPNGGCPLPPPVWIRACTLIWRSPAIKREYGTVSKHGTWPYGSGNCAGETKGKCSALQIHRRDTRMSHCVVEIPLNPANEKRQNKLYISAPQRQYYINYSKVKTSYSKILSQSQECFIYKGSKAYRLTFH